MSRTHTKVYRALDPLLAEFGFVRSGGAMWRRPCGVFVQCIHLHKFTFTTAFRIHAAIHPASAVQDWNALNGPASSDGWATRKVAGLPLAKYSFEYAEDDSATWGYCAGQIASYVRELVLPWFRRWQDVHELVSSPASPLSADMRAAMSQSRNAEPIRLLATPDSRHT
jgi:hypothetical protein